MKTLFKLLPAALITVCSVSAIAADLPQSDPATALAKSVSTRNVSVKCQGQPAIKVKYGFDKKGKPVYAEANLNGKTRFMPINENRTDNVGVVFGDDDNFSLMTGPITKKKMRGTTVSIQEPNSTFIAKNCRVR